MTGATKPSAPRWVTVSEGLSGWFAVLVWTNPEGYVEPYDTGMGRYRSREEAEQEGREWADAEGLEFFAAWPPRCSPRSNDVEP
ncbi:MAG: hypothetical protein EPO32_14815 [Anaerolineae bacterium]|nr:MAG: hypothetical protein EPO32_14815 [Anaerolineae bacterium]